MDNNASNAGIARKTVNIVKWLFKVLSTFISVG
jgi:hypothetical protein